MATQVPAEMASIVPRTVETASADRPSERRHARAGTLRGQLTVLLVLQLFAAGVLGGPFLVVGALANDRFLYYPLFRDTLHSLNVHGELPWWNPAIATGFPLYYIGLLEWPGRDPIFAAIAAIVWALGRFGLIVTSYLGLYVAYFAFLIPLMLNLSLLALARQILRHPLAIYGVVVLAAFSPGVVFSMSDMQTELTTYGFLFAATFLRFLRKPDRTRFLHLSVPTLAMALSLTFLELFWNVFFVPAFVAAACLTHDGVTAQAKRALRTVTATQWTALAVGVFICALPTFVTSTHGTDIILSATGDQMSGYTYKYTSLHPGTPLEALALSTPGIGFEWTDYLSPTAVFEVRPKAIGGRLSSYGYLGLLTLPLACVGLVCGRRYWSTRLWMGIAAGLTVFVLSAYSPVFSLLLGWNTPFRAVNHFSDTAFRLGLYVLFLLAAGLGIEALFGTRTVRRWSLCALFVLTSSASVAWLIALQHGTTSDNYLFGLTLALCLLYGVALVRLATARSRAEGRFAFVMLLPLFLVDTATFAFAHERLSLPNVTGVTLDPAPTVIGTRQDIMGSGDYLHLRGVDRTNPGGASIERAVLLRSVRTDLPLSTQIIEIIGRTYNAVSMRLEAPEESRLEWRDAYFPFWRAWVNGAEVPVQRTSAGMKAVQVPRGTSTVSFRFAPTLLPVLVPVSFVPLAAVVMWLLVRLVTKIRRSGLRPSLGGLRRSFVTRTV